MIWLARFAVGAIALYLWFRDGYYWVMGRFYRKKVWGQIWGAIEEERINRGVNVSGFLPDEPPHHTEPPLSWIEMQFDDETDSDGASWGDDGREFYMQDPDNGPDR